MKAEVAFLDSTGKFLAAQLRYRVDSVEIFPRARNLEIIGLVLGCMEAKFWKEIVNTRWKALAEIDTMYPFASFSRNLVWLKRYINMKTIIKKMKNCKN